MTGCGPLKQLYATFEVEPRCLSTPVHPPKWIDQQSLNLASPAHRQNSTSSDGVDPRGLKPLLPVRSAQRALKVDGGRSRLNAVWPESSSRRAAA